MNNENPLRTASALALEGKTEEAIACLESALAPTRSDKQRPADTSTLASKAGLLCEAAGSLPQAALYYEEAVATGDGDPLLLIALADVRWRLGQADRARSCLATVESMPNSFADRDVLAMVANMRAKWAGHR